MKVYQLISELMKIPAGNDVQIHISKILKQQLKEEILINCFNIDTVGNDQVVDTCYLYIGECE
jgi:hypothetical protein